MLSFSDASESGWGSFTAQVGGKVAVGSWSLEEMGRSSTFCELRAARHVLESLAPHLKGSEVLHRTDNKNTEIWNSVHQFFASVDLIPASQVLTLCQCLGLKGENSALLFNHCLLLGRFYIYSCKYKNI